MRSDFFSARQFRDLPLYTEAYRPFGLSNHLCIPVTGEAGAAIHCSVQRNGGADFNERDRAVIAQLQPHLAAARALARERPGGGVVSPVSFRHLGLTPRETEVFHWLVEGKRNAEIAAILRLRLQTVKAHVAEIFGKLRVENRHSAMRAGFEAARQVQRDEIAAAGRGLRAFSLRREAA
jgi:DNA-binding CsgD family transcriptional regulator